MIRPYLILFVLILSLAIFGCSKGTSSINSDIHSGQRITAPVLKLTATTLRTTSAAPKGVRLTWGYVTGATGYYLYRSESTLPEFGTIDPSFRVNGGALIKKGDPNAVFDDKASEVTFDDLFAALPDKTYYYRVTAYDGVDESNPSNEITIKISPQTISNLNPATGYIGDSIDIEGDYFGDTQEVVDYVYFLGVDGKDTLATVNSWSKTKINVKVPKGIQNGKVKVVINGTIAESPMGFVVKDPYITGLTPSTGFPGDKVTIAGNNFGDSQKVSTVKFNGISVVTFESWKATEIVCFVPAGQVEGDVIVTVDGIASNPWAFLVGIFVEKITPNKQHQDKVIQIDGKHFGAAQAAGYVGFSGYKGEVPVSKVESWADGVIKVKVPPTAVDGPVRVYAGLDAKSLQTGNSADVIIYPWIFPDTSDKLGSSYDIIKLNGSGFSDKDLKVKAVFTFEVPFGKDILNFTVKPEKVTLIDPFNVTLEIPSDVGFYPGSCSIVATRDDGTSNAIPFTIDEMLTGKFTGIEQDKFYLSEGGVLTLTLTTVSNTEKSELVIGTTRIPATKVEAGRFTADLDISKLVNGKYDVYFDLFRRAINLPSESIPAYLISKQGDLDLNNKVNKDDLLLIQTNYGKKLLDAEYSPLLDANLDGVIDERDASIIGLNYGK